MTHTSSRLPLLAALCIGIAVGALGISALQSQPRAAPVELHPGASDDGQTAQMMACIKALVRVEGLLHELLARPVPTPTASVEPQESGRQPIETVPERVHADASDLTTWVAAIEESVAQLLVEHGLTPYDPGVAVHVTNAGKALRRAASDYRAAISALASDSESGLIHGPEITAVQRRLWEERTSKRKEALDQLEAALDALVKGTVDDHHQ